MLLQSLLLVLFLKCFAITAAANDAKAAFKSSSLTKPFEETLKTAKPKQRSGWGSQGTSFGPPWSQGTLFGPPWSQGTPFGPREQQTKVTKQKTSKDGEKSENPFHKIHWNFPALERVPSAALWRRGGSWGGFENIASRGVDGSKILKNEGEHAGLARPQSSLKHVGKTGNVSMVTDGQDVEMATPAVNNNKRRPVKGEDENGMKEQHCSGHKKLTTAPWGGGKRCSQDERSGTLEVTLQQPHSSHMTQDQHPLKMSVDSGKAQEAFSEDSGTTTKNNVGLKGIVSEGFRVRGRVKEMDVNVPIWDRKVEMKAQKMVVWENGKVEERTREQRETVDGRKHGDKKGEQMMMGNQGVVEKMRKLEMLMGERMKGDKESKRMILDGLGKKGKEAREQEMLVGEGTKGGKEGKRMLLGDRGRRMILGGLGKTKGARDQGMLVGEGTKGVKEGRRMILGGLGKTKGARDQGMLVGEGTKGVKEGRRMIVRKQKMLVSARMKGFEKGERMIAGRVSETTEGMKIGGTDRKERQGEEVMTGENMKTRDRKYIVGDHDDVTIGFVRHQNGWIPSWIIKAVEVGERKKNWECCTY